MKQNQQVKFKSVFHGERFVDGIYKGKSIGFKLMPENEYSIILHCKTGETHIVHNSNIKL